MVGKELGGREMNVILTMDDFPSDKKNCGNCTRRGGACPRNEKRHPNGYVMNQGTKEVGGVIYCCPNYTGRFENKNVQLKLDLTI